MQEMIYIFGIRLEFKSTENDSSSLVATAVAAVASQTEVIIRLLAEKLVVLTTKYVRNRSYRDRGIRSDIYRPRNDRDRNDRNDRDRNDRSDRDRSDTRVCEKTEIEI